jgi:hypothetical protein
MEEIFCPECKHEQHYHNEGGCAHPGTGYNGYCQCFESRSGLLIDRIEELECLVKLFTAIIQADEGAAYYGMFVNTEK